MSTDISSVIAPATIETLKAAFLELRPVLMEGSAGLAANIMTRLDLDELLDRMVVAPGMLRLELGGAKPITVPIEQILTGRVSGRGELRKINTRALRVFLEQGATLVMHNVESLSPDIARLCSSLHQVCQCPIDATLFLVRRPQRPLGGHCDTCDMVIYQLAGDKQWPVYEPKERNPITPHIDLEKCRKACDYTLRAGNVLYLPRGWPHNPFSNANTSVHVCLTIKWPTGRDLLKALFERLVAGSNQVREPLPILQGPEEQRRYASELRRQIVASLTDDFCEAYCIRMREANGRGA
jgi:hypothetical protein